MSEEHPYLRAKGVRPFGLRVDWRGTLLIPIYNRQGDIVSLQMIFGHQGTFAGRFVANSTVSGNVFIIGCPKDRQDLVLAEDYVTAATIHQATGKPVAVCFDCCKLAAAATAMRQQYPNSRIILAADDDRFGKDGNTGVEKAQAAAKAVDGYIVLPFWSDMEQADAARASNFNDMATLFGEDAVRLVFGKRCRPANRWFPCPDGAFALVPEKGVYYVRVADTLEKDDIWTWLSTPLTVDARVVDDVTKDWFHLLTFRDHNLETCEEIIPDRLLCKRGTDLLEILVDHGFQITQSNIRARLKDYISLVHPDKTIIRVNRTGWYRKNFVLPGLTIYHQQNDRREIRYGGRNDFYQTAGTLDDWQENVAKPAAGNTRLVFAISVALAGPLLDIIRAESGGFGFTSRSSAGKSSAFNIAASVWGPPEKGVQSWNATANAIEALLMMHNDMVLILDEISTVNASDGSRVAYMFANRRGKARMNADTSLREVASWNALLLSNGEKSMKTHAAEAGIRLNAGQELRLSNIDADAGKGMGILEDTHGLAPEDFLTTIRTAASRYHGTAGQAWLRRIVRNRNWLEKKLGEFVERFASNLAKGIDSSQVRRKAKQFALVGIAGEMARRYGITGWKRNEAFHAVRACFNSWLEDFGAEDKERANVIGQIRRFIEEYKDSRFSPIRDTVLLHQKRAGYTQEFNGVKEYLFYTTTFNEEVCKGFDPKMVRQLLASERLLRIRTSVSKETGKTRQHYEVHAIPVGEG